MSVAIETIKVKIGDEEITLSIAEARELQSLLNETFGTKAIISMPYNPIIIERPVYYRPYKYWDITWDDSTAGRSTITYALNSSANTSDVVDSRAITYYD